ncbi:hypothetical protein RO3G_10075 [Rhizopus delemar RA 99-880]|uniref:Uncharacterized protein n=1 Tax=Rhizopus delemar (strain RA 99-880 / ATCC MYA-4621 / FGSC 9543 / NRRL 43880) TaxID=246409 RepID=I1CA85_RHIO9|nr:hypothetical protein RO3G_10075 [Rhizopus delemar RA 99-880]|eukprot:EIE85365.1 hypothetical protein RO3G_10075 [Rhizopus delemar RA 99-880]
MGTAVMVLIAYLYLNLTTVAMEIFINNSRSIGAVKFPKFISEKSSVMPIKIAPLLEIRKS